ncbi:hypothetical protein PIB30_014650 [Stylosanthes scabra]|uniref:Uncharacterized protein n=1 Tax=Stylosanthes scabra TaxID=79078 RepID=A0ABU6S737_9FABA|nr:hypothetical protein [Stylosanthes scabra]
MEQVKDVDEYFYKFLPYFHRFEDSSALKLFLSGLAPYIHRENFFDDPKTLAETFCLAKILRRKMKTTSSSLEIQEEIKEESDVDSTDKSNEATISSPNSEIQSLKHPNQLQHQQSSCQKSEILDEKEEVATELINSSEQIGNSLIVEEEEQTIQEEDCNHSAIAETGQRTFAAFENGAAIEKKNSAATVTNGDLQARQLRRFVSLMPPPLLAAFFPWNRDGDDEEQSHDG